MKTVALNNTGKYKDYYIGWYRAKFREDDIIKTGVKYYIRRRDDKKQLKGFWTVTEAREFINNYLYL